MPLLNINTDEVVALTSKLEKIRKRSIPKVVGQTLNALAFETKKILPKQYIKSGYEQRQKNFFSKATKHVEKVSSFDINKMHSIAGVSTKIISNEATKNMVQHESGGRIKKSFTPMDTARTSKSNSKKVKKKNMLHNLGSIPGAGHKNRVAKNDKKKFIRRSAALSSQGGGILVYGKFVYRILSFKRQKKRKIKKPVKAEFLYKKNTSKSITVGGGHVVRKTGIKIGKKVNRIFVAKMSKEIFKLQ